MDNTLAFGFRLNGDFTGTNVNIRAGATDGGGNPNAFDEYNTTFTRADTNTAWAANFSMTYTIATGAVEFFIDGGSVASATYSGDVGGIWIKPDSLSNVNPHAGFLLDNVLVTSVPEPSVLALFILGLAGLLNPIRRTAQPGCPRNRG